MSRKFLAAILFAYPIFAQSQSADLTYIDPASAPGKILIIPYEPRMHLSDADHDISEYSEKSAQQIRSMFRMAVSEQVNGKLRTSYSTHSLAQDLRPEAQQEMQRIYHAIDYSYDTSFAILHPKPDTNEMKGKWSASRERKKQIEKRTPGNDIKYMNVQVLDPNLFTELNAKYGADLFVFITQFEIKTNYADCLDLSLKIYQRDYKIHYAVFDLSGKQLWGDVAVLKTTSGTNMVNDIIAQEIPVLSEQVKDGVTK